MTFLVQYFPLALLAAVVQVVAALPWLIVLVLELRSGEIGTHTLAGVRGAMTRHWRITLRLLVIATLAGSALLTPLIGMGRDHTSLQYLGGAYGALLHLQLTVDFFVVVFALLFLFWPKGAAVALAAFREGWRQPMFWLITGFALLLMIISIWLPYFTLEQGDERHVGGDYKMVKELGYDFTMLAAALFGVLAASMSISEEIEGRTAITLMSKPISRRQFLVGKFVGILLAAFIITGALSWIFDGTLLLKAYYDKEVVRIPPTLEDWTLTWSRSYGEVPAYFLRGAGFWMFHALSAVPGVILGFCQVMVLTAIAVALATRLPMVVNLVVCLIIFFLGHLAPVLQQAALGRGRLVPFMAQLIDYLTPALELFNLGPVIVRDTPPPTGDFSIYVGMVSLYAALYTTIALLVGLILFEDRDLA
jgi:ABC-type transport system involved in multi-copper enzyme maturation permease subunit